MRFNFEQNSASEKEVFIGDPEINQAHTRAEKVLSSPINPRDFTDYRDVDKDIAHIEDMERRFKQQDSTLSPEDARRQKLAKIFEAIIFEQAEQANWLGENAATIQTSRYDDIVNKVDTIVEFQEGPSQASHLALAIDVTIGDHLEKKFHFIKDKIDAGELATIKYFHSEHMGLHGRKTGVPHVVIGIDRKTMYELLDAWRKNDTKRLADHPVQIKILEAIRVQLEAYKKYAQSIGQLKLVPIIEQTETLVQDVMRQKEIDGDDLRDAYQDEVLYSIKFAAEHLADLKKA